MLLKDFQTTTRACYRLFDAEHHVVAGNLPRVAAEGKSCICQLTAAIRQCKTN